MTKKYIEYKQKGLCVRCGSKPLLGKTRCKKCHADHLRYQAEAKKRLKAKGLCHYCGVNKRSSGRSMCLECLEKHNKNQKIRYRDLRKRVLEAYGGVCVCCGLKNEKYLQLDHVNNDGKEHRLRLSGCRKGGMYAWAEKNGYPKTLQLLCANCHQAKTSHGGCTKADHAAFKRYFRICPS